MSLISRSIPGLFGGVSQQVPAMRHPTQGAEQLNGLATTTDGLTKRPGSRFVARLARTGANGASIASSFGNAHVHWIDKGPLGLYALVLVAGNMMLYDAVSGSAQVVTFPNGNTYLNGANAETDFRAVTVADYTFITNLTKVPAMTSAVTGLNPTNVAYVNVKTAVPSTTYAVTVNGFRTAVTSPANPTNESIAEQLRAALAAQWPSDAVSVIPGTNVLKLVKGSGSYTSVTSSDGWSNTATQTIHNGVDTFADLPPKFETGFVVTINGQASSAKDKYYVQWNGTRWEETVKPGLSTTIDAATMPHQLRPNGDGTWTFERATWDTRKAGDEDTNPQPSFIGAPIRGIFFHRNRLGFLAADAVVLSRAGSYFNFFSTSATQVLDTDPIDLGAPSEDVQSLDWAVRYNDDLVIFATNKQQFKLTAGDIMSPTTARLLPATTFETYNGAKPAPLGNRLVFAADTGPYTQLSLYRVSEDTLTNRSEDLTEHVQSYVPASPRTLVSSTAVKALAVLPRAVSQAFQFFKYTTNDKDVMEQKAWQEFRFESPDTVRILSGFWRSRSLYLLMHVTSAVDAAPGGRFRMEVIDFDSTAVDAHANFSIRLDSRVLVTAGGFNGTHTAVTVPYLCAGAPPTLLKVVDGAEPVELVTTSATAVHDTVNLTTTFLAQGNHQGAYVWVGRPYLFRYTFTEPVVRDQQSNPIMAVVNKVKSYLVRYKATGYFEAKVKHLLRSTYTYPVSGRSVGVPGQGASQLALSDGEFSIPVQAKANAATVSLESYSYFPVTIPYAEWTADVTMKASR